MALRITTVVGVTAAVLVVSTTCATGASAKPGRVAVVHAGRTAVETAAVGVCFDQLGGNSGIGIDSKKVADGSVFNTRAADDFTLTEPCTVRSLDVDGVIERPDLLLDVSIVIYRDAGGTPGAIVARRTVPAAKVTLDGGSFHVPLGSPVGLDRRTYWLGFRAHMSPGGGDWDWFANQPQRGNLAVWKNPGDGYGVGCTTYQPLTVCFGSDVSYDFEFAVNETL